LKWSVTVTAIKDITKVACCRFGFVTYTSAAKCKQMHDSMQGHVYKGRSLVVLYGKKRSEMGKRKNKNENG